MGRVCFSMPRYTVADRSHGYCVDDNARALIVAVTAQDLQPLDSSLGDLASVYLSFLGYAFNDQTGRFRNFMSYDRRWLEESGSEDSHGRAVWGLGVAVALGRDKGQVGLCGRPVSSRAGRHRTFHITHGRLPSPSLVFNAYLCGFSGDSPCEKNA